MQKREPQASILIVDDTPDNLRLLSQILSENGYRVRVAAGGRRALASVQLDRPDLILLDIKMPNLDGFDTCRALKAEERTKNIPVLFISALDDVTDKVRAFRVGGLDYITKPFQPEEVLARVETHLALYRLQRQLARTNRRMAQELALAGQVQTSFLPDSLPSIPGWQMSVTLLPARETSGDFYDVFALPNGRFGLLVADVVDKGVCAALFMALTYALFRTYAVEQALAPAAVLAAVNNHILNDTHANQFVTVFYGVLDPAAGTLLYGNAGHCPGLLLGAEPAAEPSWLPHTGIPLGIMPDAVWAQRSVMLAPGAALLLYTDGLIEAEDEGERPFGLERLSTYARAGMGETAVHLKEGLIRDVQQFAGQRSLLDDLVLFAVTRRL